MWHSVVVVMFAMSVGFTASGIVANVYRLAAGPRQDAITRTAYYISMVIAGPNYLCAHAARALRARTCSHSAFWLAAAIAGYWSLALGLLVLNVALAL